MKWGSMISVGNVAILNVSINTAVSGYMVDLFCYVMGQYLPVRPMCGQRTGRGFMAAGSARHGSEYASMS